MRDSPLGQLSLDHVSPSHFLHPFPRPVRGLDGEWGQQTIGLAIVDNFTFT